MFRLKFKCAAKASFIETVRFPAENGGSRDFLSYRAVEKRRGRWDIYFCNYLRADTAETRAARQRLLLEPAVHSIVVAKGREESYRAAVDAKPFKAGVNRDEAVRFLKEIEAEEAVRSFIDKHAPNLHDRHYSRFVSASPAPAAPPRP